MARSFNGSTDKIVSPTVSAGLPTTAMTTSAWVNGSAFSNAYNAPFSFESSGAVGSFLDFFVKSTGKLAWYTQNTTPNEIFVDPGITTLSTNVWYNLVAVSIANGVTFTLTGYVNATQDATTSTAAAGIFTPWAAPTTFGIGFDPSFASRQWTGSIADAAIWNVALTTFEITALANGALPGQIRPLNLMAWLPLDGSQSPEPDFSGNIYNGTVTGTAKAVGPPVMPFTPRWHRMPGLMVPVAGLNWIVQRRNKLGWKPKH